MPLVAGDKLGPYEILGLIGAGGMGEVYMARDSRLGRNVAIKVSAERFSERFEREARAIAALNHPNICHLYDVGPNYLVMELIEGPTLAERLKQDKISLEESLNIARQVADALEAAHEKGITHRDLKPGNVKIKPDGTVKVLDFGLAKIGGTPTAQSDHSPTITMGQTEAGMILGTAAYMSPEQAKGKQVDQRADIYSFGVVLYEMVTGTRLHRGESTAEVLASVLKEAPQWDKVPSQVRKLLKNCLDKDPHKRLRHIGDVMRLVEEAPAVSSPPTELRKKAALAKWLWAAAGVAVLGVAAVVWAPWRKTVPTQVVRFEVGPPEKIKFVDKTDLAISPDGRWMVFPAQGEDGMFRYWLRSLDGEEARVLPGTEGPLTPPAAWSHDSRWVLFANNTGVGKLKKVNIQSGTPQEISDFRGTLRGGDSNADGVIIAGAAASPILKVSTSGGTLTPVTALGPGDTYHGWPQFLPDGKHFLYARGSRGTTMQGISIGSIDLAPNQQSNDRLLNVDGQAYYSTAPGAGSGYLVFLRGTTLMAQPFDPNKRTLSGEPVAIADNVDSFFQSGHGLFTVSDTGTLVYRHGAGDQTVLTWVDPKGTPAGTLGDAGDYNSPSLSPDGSRVAVAANRALSRNIWILDVARGSSTRFTVGPEEDFPAWSPDGKWIAYSSKRGPQPDLYLKPADNSGEEKLLVKDDEPKRADRWTKDGRFLLFTSTGTNTRQDLWALPFPGEAKSVSLLQTQFAEIFARVSPDGHWMAYTSNKSGGNEVYVRPFAPGAAAGIGPELLISRGGGATRPLWAPDGKQLYYLVAGGFQVEAVDIDMARGFHAGAPRRIFTAPSTGLARGWDISPDGKHFLFAAPLDYGRAAPFTVVLNWAEGLKKK